MSSTSAAGVSIITLQFNLGLTLDVAEQEVQAAINAGNSLLPADLPAPPVYAKVNPADAPVLTLAITSDSDAAAPTCRTSSTRGWRRRSARSRASASSRSPAASARRCASRPTRRRWPSYGIDLRHAAHRHHQRQRQQRQGQLRRRRRASYTINANDQLVTVDDYKNLIVAYKNGAPVRLTDVAQVVDSAENLRAGAPGPTTRRPSSSTCSASRAPT